MIWAHATASGFSRYLVLWQEERGRIWHRRDHDYPSTRYWESHCGRVGASRALNLPRTPMQLGAWMINRRFLRRDSGEGDA